MTSTDTKGFLKTAILFPVFIPTIIVIVLVLLGTISNPELAGQFFSEVLSYVTNTFGWFYMLAVATFLIFIVGIAMSNWGNIKLGPDHAEPEYSFLSWFAMLFSAGYGIALLFLAWQSLSYILVLRLKALREQLKQQNKQCKFPISTGDFIFGQFMG